jgi:hypothetical protein
LTAISSSFVFQGEGKKQKLLTDFNGRIETMVCCASTLEKCRKQKQLLLKSSCSVFSETTIL